VLSRAVATYLVLRHSLYFLSHCHGYSRSAFVIGAKTEETSWLELRCKSMLFAAIPLDPVGSRELSLNVLF
ncbi:hypothetical protein ADUPG1_003276, partial [Aduncisulcus paluster]|jgi:hypothetical protein